MLLGMLSLLQMTTNSLLDTLLQELFTPNFVYANAPLSPERPKSKRFNNFIYWDLVRDLKMLNERHYEQCLKDSGELRECEVYLNPPHLKGLKKFIGPWFCYCFLCFCQTSDYRDFQQEFLRCGFSITSDSGNKESYVYHCLDRSFSLVILEIKSQETVSNSF